MSQIPDTLKFTKDHEWLRDNGDGTAFVGITDYAQTSLGDVTFAELPEVGAHLDAGQSLGVVESVKAASDVYMPVAGTVTAVNGAIESDPSLMNTDPYGKGYLIAIKLDNAGDLAKLLSPSDYAKLV
jgi:glycine cleavage system H protein